MIRTVKILLLVFIAVLAVLLAYRMLSKPAADGSGIQEPSGEAGFSGPSPFEGLGLRYDGHYRCDRGDLRYLMRFWPEGRVVLVNGTKQIESTLPAFLTRDTKGNPAMGLYNVMARVEGDSLYFVTRPEKGEISYRGRVESASRVHFHRYSHITGKHFDMDYLFVPDTAAALLPQDGQQVR